jgi:hypothetical protein
MITTDRFLPWPICMAVAAPIALDIIDDVASYPGRYGGLFILINALFGMSYLFGATGYLFASIKHLAEKQWRKSSSCLSMPLFILCFFALPRTIADLGPGDYVHFLIFSHYYTKEIDATGESRPRWFYWRDASSPFNARFIYLVFDESDGLAVPPLQDVEGGELQSFRHLFGHWYVVELN